MGLSFNEELNRDGFIDDFPKEQYQQFFTKGLFYI